MSAILPSLLENLRRRRPLGLILASIVLGAAAPCWAQDSANTAATTVIVEPPNAQIAADFISKSGVALSVLTPNAGSSSVTVSVAAAPQQASLAAQTALLTSSAGTFRSLIPIGAAVSILDTRLLFDYADIYGTDNVLLVLLQYN